MAAILREVLDGRITVKELVSWLISSSEGTPETPRALKDLVNLKPEFVLFFVNYLRDQTHHLLQSSKSACQSPSKTPTNLKFSKPNTRSETNPGSSKRVQLFGASPSESRQENRFKQSTPKDVASILNSPNISVASPVSFRNAGSGKKHSKISPISEGKPKQFSSSSHTPEFQRMRHKSCLGEFILSPDLDNRRRRSPLAGSAAAETELQADFSPSPQMHRRSSGKKKGGSSSEKARRIVPTSVPSPPVFSLSNMDDFPPFGATSTEKESSSKLQTAAPRRINPTPISQEGRKPTSVVFSPLSPAHCSVAPSVKKSVFTTAQENMCITLEQERKLLREERAKRSDASSSLSESQSCDLPIINVTPKKTTEKPSTVTPKKLNLDRTSSVTEVTTAELSEVTYSHRLDTLCDLYSQILDENLVPNLAVELYFIVQLLTVRCSDYDLAVDTGQDADEINHFMSVHNGVYFAVHVLNKQIRLVRMLDRGTLRLFVDNCRIINFCSELRQQLKIVNQENPQTVSQVLLQPPIGSVSFQAETDNRNNFPSDKSFQLFKKQRDLFYELIRIWESKHMNPGWSMGEELGQKIQALIGYRTELANYVHFARLFQSQLIHMCRGEGRVKASESEEDTELLSQLKQTNPEKFKKLQERFTTPSNLSGPSPPPSFPGPQEFFRDFIMIACNHVFNQHLINSLASKLKELKYFDSPKQDTDSTETVEGEQKDMFRCSLLTLRLLGKFLGFLTFYPFQTLERLPNSTHTACLAMRNQMPPPVDIVQCLRESWDSGQGVLTIPWIVDFLSMMDLDAPLLDYYQTVLSMLLQIHKLTGENFKKSRNTALGHLLILLLLGWLFDLHVMPEGLFFSEDQKATIQVMTENSLIYGLVDLHLLYTCCPYIGEIKSLLLDFTIGTSSKNATIRKIKPHTTAVKTATSVSEKQLQMQLEENFFHNHPASLRRCVEFVADRIASNYVKKYRARVLPKLLCEGSSQVTESLKTVEAGSSDLRVKEKMTKRLDDLCTLLRDKGKKKFTDEMNSYCMKNSKGILQLLLPEDTTVQVLSAATQIAQQIAQEKITTWVNTQITSNFFKRDLSVEFDKQWRQIVNSKSVSPSRTHGRDSDSLADVSMGVSHESQLPVALPAASSHDASLPSPSDMLNQFKDMLKNVVLRRQFPEEDEVLSIVSQLSMVVAGREDLLPGMYRMLSKVSVELAIMLVAQHPACYTLNVQQAFLDLWCTHLRSVVNMAHMFSSKNVHLVNNSTTSEESWKKYCSLLRGLSKHGFFTMETIEQQSFLFVQQIGSEDKLEHVSQCICCMIEEFQGTPHSVHTGHQLLEVLIWLQSCSLRTSQLKENLEACVLKLQLMLNAVAPSMDSVSGSSLTDVSNSSTDARNTKISNRIASAYSHVTMETISEGTSDTKDCKSGTKCYKKKSQSTLKPASEDLESRTHSKSTLQSTSTCNIKDNKSRTDCDKIKAENSTTQIKDSLLENLNSDKENLNIQTLLQSSSETEYAKNSDSTRLYDNLDKAHDKR